MRYLMATFFFFLAAALVASAEVQVVGDKKVECKDGVCVLVEDDDPSAVQRRPSAISLRSIATFNLKPSRMAQGYMSAEAFVAFLENKQVNPLGDAGLWVTLLLVLLGGLAMNLTPCVLPMVPINLMIIGRSAKRGTAYGLGMAIAYGVLGIAAAFGGLAFGGIQGSPWFNAAVTVVFVALALALFDVWFIDLSRLRSGMAISEKRLGSRFPALGVPFLMGAVSAVLAGACVAPVLISVLLLTTDWVAAGHRTAVLLPFVMGLGMALPWPFLGAGMKVLPRPGAWMKGVNRLLGVIVLGFAVWYGWLAWQGFQSSDAARTPRQRSEAIPSTPNSQLSTLNSESAKPILVDCWATWCKNCSAMDGVMEDERVKKALEPYEIIRVQSENISELRKVKGFESIRGLPAFVIFD